jgi:MoCo/4Fe-4S cofactor protein with predicted Tat translocation signal
MSDSNKHLDLPSFRARLRADGYWRSLDELARSGEEFDEFFDREFPQQAIPLAKGVDRRNFVKLMGASVAMAGLAACKQPAETIVPYVRQPENLIPGKPLFFASSMPLSGYSTGVLVESHMNRPTKIEGNPDHPSSLGASDAYMQAAVLGLYDPDRSQVVRRLGEISTWSEFIAAVQPALKEAQTNGAGFRLLTQTISSPTLAGQIQQLLSQYPGMQWHQWEPVNQDNAREGSRLAFGSYSNTVYHFDKANVVVSLGSDFLGDGPGHLRYSKDFSARRRVRKGSTSMNRLYSIESSPSPTGSLADHRLAVKPSQIEGYARAIAAALGLGAPGGTTENAPWIAALARDLQANRGAVIVVPGDDQPPAVHAIAHAINQALGSIGTAVTITESVEAMPVNQLESLRALVTDMNAGKVKALVMLGGNPVFDAPADFHFRDALIKVPFRVHLSPYYDETSRLAHWHIPETHFLETWGDGRGHDGTVSIQQPLIAPLYNGRSPLEVLGALIGGLDASPYDTVRNYWMARSGGQAPSPVQASVPASPVPGQAGAPALQFENTWRKWLNDGVIANTALPAKAVSASLAIPAPATRNPQPATTLELQLRHDPTIYDGRFANNSWLQELPKPQTKIVWENVLLVGPATAEELKIRPSDGMVNEKTTWLVDLEYRGQRMTVPVWVVPGQAPYTLTLTYGYGREQAGHVGNGIGVNAYRLRLSDAMHGGGGAKVTNTDRDCEVACTQEHQNIDAGGAREIVRAGTFAEWQHNPSLKKGEEHPADPEQHENISMWPEYKYDQYRWAMSIDTSVCTGCNGCVIACQSENNIPVVGKDQVHRERELHWLRIDRYYKGNPENPEVYHQPVPCMQCENAPCEPVCPVGATSHSGDGLNDMTYNRCVGTRYCSNNCPYKVRRFNFYQYSEYDTPALKGMRNPDVTVRTRGVMEKCTYCVQRINEAKIEAEKQNRRVKDGEIVTACQQACPSEAIIFGDLNDPNSRVSKLKAEPTNYGLLEELNTKPRTTYLATVRNPNPEMKA